MFLEDYSTEQHHRSENYYGARQFAAIHLRHSLRKLELALYDFGVFEGCMLVLCHSFLNNIAMVEMRLNQGFVAGLPRARSARGTEPHTHRIWSASFRLVFK